MSKRERVIVAMSGGVDSSLAAALLVDQGYDVVGVTLHLWDYPEGQEPGRCCAPEDQHDARNASDAIGIPHFTFDRRELFQSQVVKPFVDAYLDGKTPSPCVSCNRTVKLHELFAIATKLGADLLATGHYARIERAQVHRPASGATLHRGVDREKDQSYFLHSLVSPEAKANGLFLDRMLFPLGALTKEEVRRDAQARKLPGAFKGESQELCFIPSGGYSEFVTQRSDGRVRPGRILGQDGGVVGTHQGVHQFTIGQRKGLGIALGKPVFVSSVDAESGDVVVGDEESILSEGALLGADARFASDVSLPFSGSVQVRARHSGAPARIEEVSGSLQARFDAPVRAVSPGQIAVAYDGDRVVGGATIVRPIQKRSKAALPFESSIEVAR